jgi:hypothetical protein
MVTRTKGAPAGSRDGKIVVTAYLPAPYKKSLRLVQAESSETLQDILAEALNDFFKKRGVPTIQE